MKKLQSSYWKKTHLILILLWGVAILTSQTYTLSAGGTDLELKHEKDEHYQFSIGTPHCKKVLRHVPKNVTEVFCQFLLLTGCIIEVEVMASM